MSNPLPADIIQPIALKELVVSSTGPQAERRKHFNKAAIDELAESIKTVGVLSPILARKVNGHFEVVFGERRYLAAKLAGLAAIPASVRELTDEQVLEVQLIENLQREGLHELAEAEDYEALLKFGHSAEDIAEKVGKSKGYVYARMKLLALCQDARKAFYDGKLNASTALLLARIPVDALQKEALKKIADPRWHDGPMTVREAQEIIHRDYTTRLADAGFPTEDAELVPTAGVCSACPKRTGNQPELFDDIKGADVCTDPVCFKAKREAHAARAIAAAKVTGQKVISGKEAKKVAPNGADSGYLQGYKALDAKPYEDPKNRTVRQLLGKDYQPTLLHDPDTGKLVKVAPEADVKKALKDAGVKGPAAAPREKPKPKETKADTAFRELLFSAIHTKAPKKLTRDVLERLVDHEMDAVGELPQMFFTAWGWDADNYDFGKLSEPDLQRLLYEILIVSEFAYSDPATQTEQLTKVAKFLGVDIKKVRADATAVAGERDTPAPKKKARKGK